MIYPRLSVVIASGAFLVPLVLLTGCGSNAPSMVSVVYPDVTGNWQIQTSAVPVEGQLTNQSVLLLGALQSTGADVNGTFRFSYLEATPGCPLDEVVTLSGTTDSEGNLSLSSATLTNGAKIKVALHAPVKPTPLRAGSIEVDGSSCAIASSAAIGGEIASVTGIFGGPLSAGAASSAGTVAGSASLTLSQSATPGVDGRFPVTGMLTYTLGTCSGTVAMSGDVSGVGMTIAAVATPLSRPSVSLLGLIDPTADQISVANAEFTSFSCMGTQPAIGSYSGKFTRQ